MKITDKLSEYLGEAVIGLKRSGSGFDLIRKDQPESTRFSILFLDGGGATLYDRKTTKKTNIDTEGVQVDPGLIKKSSETKSIIFDFAKLIQTGKVEFHDYFKGLVAHLPEKPDWRVLNGKIYAIYRNRFGDFAGIKKYPEKRAVKGSALRGAFVCHAKAANSVYFIGEGFRECLLCASLIDDATVYESGGLGNIPELLKIIPPDSNITLMGENDSKEAYQSLKKNNPHIKVVFPPKGKDFADAVFNGVSKYTIRDTLLGHNLNDERVIYKPLGVIGEKIAVYSKIFQNVVLLNPDKCNAVLRACSGTRDWEAWRRLDKERFSNSVFYDCVKQGEFDSEVQKGPGLWKRGEDYLYNTGKRVYFIHPDSITESSFFNVLRNDFLVCRSQTKQPKLPKSNIDIEKILSVLRLCDFKYEWNADLLLGFLAQSVFAGVNDKRIHLWLTSDATTAGKSWLTNWLKNWLVPFSRSSGGALSTQPGTRQRNSDYSGLLFLDEFGEEETEFDHNVRQTIELLRHATQTNDPIDFGSAEQIAKKQFVRYSALVSCINPENYLTKPQDKARFIVMTFNKSADKTRFFKEVAPKFKELEKEETKSFISLCLSKFYEYKKYQDFFKLRLSQYDIGHKVEGLAYCAAAYSAIRGGRHFGEDLLDYSLEDPELYETPTISEENIDPLDWVFTTQINSRLVDSISDVGQATIWDLFNTGKLTKYGLYESRGELVIVPKLFFPILRHGGFENRNRRDRDFTTRLKKSKHFIKFSTVRAGKGSSLRSLRFKSVESVEEKAPF